MKKNKLNEIVYRMGYKSAIKGKAKTLNPFLEWNTPKSKLWLEGWAAGVKKSKFIKEGMLSRYVNAFFDGLKTNTVNKVLNKVEPDVPEPIFKRMKELRALSAELKRDIERYERELNS